MCGRITHRYTWTQLHGLVELTTPKVAIPARYNVSPTQTVPVVAFDEGTRGAALRGARWGLIPSWAKDAAVGGTLVNARAEGLENKPSFRAAFRRRRCVVPISGFYEWMVVGERGGRGARSGKQPMYIAPSDPGDEPWLLAGLWEEWSPGDGTPIQTFTIITTGPNELMATIHNRMPVILPRDAALKWISPGTGKNGEAGPEERSELLRLLVPSPAEAMVAVPVSTLVNSPKHDVPDCIRRVEVRGWGGLFE